MTGGGCGIVVGGVDLFERFGLRLTGESSVGPPPLKRYEVDVPGGDGSIDLTDALAGGPAYGNRECELVLRGSFATAAEFERARTGLSNLLHGRRLDFELGADPGYTYAGRFEVAEAGLRTRSACVRLKVTADPYKLKEARTYRVNAAGGIVVTLESGRMPVCPTWEFASETIVAAGGVSARMQPGSYRVNDLWLREGTNEVYVNSYLGDGNVPSGRYAADAASAHAGRRLSDLIWEGVRSGAVAASDWGLDTLEMHGEERVVDAEFSVDAGSEKYAVYIRYDWKDL